MAAYGTSSHIVLCQAITGSGDSVDKDTSSNYTYIKAKEIELTIDFLSKISNNGYGKSRMAENLKYRQGFKVQNAILKGAVDVNGTTEWIMSRYIAKQPIYAIVELPPVSGSTYLLKSWFDDSQTKIYYLKGVLGKLSIKQKQGRLSRISLDFKEAFKP